MVDLRLYPDTPAVALNGALADGKANSRTGHFSPMQALEHTENCLVVSRIDPDAVVSHTEEPGVFRVTSGYMDTRRTSSPVLDCVTDEILKNL
jgi:hypothetical protein